MTEFGAFPRITACTDFSPGAQAAVERAAELAQAHGALLVLLQAAASSARTAPATVGESPLARTQAPDERTAPAELSAAGRQRLAATARQLAQQTGLQVKSEWASGTATRAIAAHLAAHAPSLLVLGSRFDPTTSGLGSTALQQVQAPICPVLVVRSGAPNGYRQVLSAVDLRDGSVRCAVTALQLFPKARHHLLYAVAPALDTEQEEGGLGAEEAQRLQEAMHQNAERELRLLAEGLTAKAQYLVSAEVASDVPARALLVRAASLGADCVVVGHHDNSTAGQTELGSMALHGVQFIPGDVLVVP